MHKNEDTRALPVNSLSNEMRNYQNNRWGRFEDYKALSREKYGLASDHALVLDVVFDWQNNELPSMEDFASQCISRNQQEVARRKEVIKKGVTDIQRWTGPEEINKPPNPRLEAAASMITPGSAVLDIGCGNMALMKLLPHGCSYIPCDVVQRDQRTIVCDFNKGKLPECNADIITVLDVLEYIYYPDKFIRELYGYKLPVIVSYHPTDAGIYLDRPAMGWVNQLSMQDVGAICREAGFSLSNPQRIANSQILWKMEPM